MKSRTKEIVASLFKNTDVKPPGQTNFTAKKCSQTNKRKRLIRHNIQCRGGKLKTDYTEKWSITESDGILSFIFPEPPLIRCPTLQVILVSSTKHTTKHAWVQNVRGLQPLHRQITEQDIYGLYISEGD